MKQPAQTSPPTGKNKINRIMLTIMIVVICIGILLVFTVSRKKIYPTQEAYLRAGGSLSFTIPETATDYRYAICKAALSKSTFYSFVLDEETLQSYSEELVDHYHIDGNDSNRYGKWYGKKAADCYDEAYTLDNFPIHLPFETVIDDSIEDYEVIVYSPTGTGTRSFGVLADKQTCRVVVYAFRAAR